MTKQNSVLLDTGFFIRLLNKDDVLQSNAYAYFKYFLEHDFAIKISTIAIAEYCVKGKVHALPLKNMMVVPFNYDHAIRAGKMIAEVYEEKKKRGAQIAQRTIIPNDTKMFAQADVETIDYFATADRECKKVYDIIKEREGHLSFDFIDITIPYFQFFGVLDI